jgi:hypothetical protein
MYNNNNNNDNKNTIDVKFLRNYIFLAFISFVLGRILVYLKTAILAVTIGHS